MTVVLLILAYVLLIVRAIPMMLAWNLLLVPNVPGVDLPLLNPAPFIAASVIVGMLHSLKGAVEPDDEMLAAIGLNLGAAIVMALLVWLLSIPF